MKDDAYPRRDPHGGCRGDRPWLLRDVGCEFFGATQTRVREPTGRCWRNVSVTNLRWNCDSVNPASAAYGASVLVLPDASPDAVRVNAALRVNRG